MTDQSLAFVFPGQGSQSLGMGKGFYDNFKVAKEVFNEVSDLLFIPDILNYFLTLLAKQASPILRKG